MSSVRIESGWPSKDLKDCTEMSAEEDASEKRM